MRDLTGKKSRDVPRDAISCDTADRRSWLANAIINSVRWNPAVDDRRREWQTVQAPAIVRYFGRARRAQRRAFSLLPYRGCVLAVCMIWLSGSDAQARCSEGKTTSGQCVDSRLAEIARQAAVIYSQPKISQTAYPVLPSVDVRYRYPNALNPDPLKPSATGVLAPN